MSNVVFILGAGASKQAGVPVMKDFLKSARTLLENNQVTDADSDFRTVIDAIGQLQGVCAKADLNLQDVESVFAAFEMARLLNRFGSYNDAQIDGLMRAMKVVIARTVEKQLTFGVEGTSATPPPPYREFANLVKHLRQNAHPAKTVSVMTFNYDLGCDFAFYFDRMPVDYALGDNADNGAVPLLKLHGSVNWALCAVCGAAVPWPIPAFFQTNRWRIMAGVGSANLSVSTKLASLQHNGHSVGTGVLVVPPTWSKSRQYEVLKPVWIRAGRELSEAENIFVIGYSRPLSDEFFRYLFTMGAEGKAVLQRFWVFNPDPLVEGRFSDLLGSAGKQAFGLYKETFNQGLQTIRREFP